MQTISDNEHRNRQTKADVPIIHNWQWRHVEDFRSGNLCFNLQVKLSRNTTLNTLSILTDDRSRIFETPSVLLGLSLQTSLFSVSLRQIWSQDWCKVLCLLWEQASGSGGSACARWGSPHTGQWKRRILNDWHVKWTVVSPSGRCGFDATLARSAADVSTLEEHYLISLRVCVCVCVREANLFPLATIDGGFLESRHGCEKIYKMHIFLIPWTGLSVTELCCSLFLPASPVWIESSGSFSPTIINTRFSQHCDTRRVIVLNHWAEKWIDLKNFRMEREP